MSNPGEKTECCTPQAGACGCASLPPAPLSAADQGGCSGSACSGGAGARPLSLVMVFLLGALAASLLSGYLAGLKKEAPEELTPVMLEQRDAAPFVQDLPTIIVAIPDKDEGERQIFIRLGLSLELASLEGQQAALRAQALLQDSVQEIVPKFGLQRIKSAEGAQDLRKRLLEAFKKRVPDAHIKAVLLRELIWQ